MVVCEGSGPGASTAGTRQNGEEKEKQDKLRENDGQNALNIYQKYYKRHFARVTSGSLRKERSKQWQYEAVQKRDSCLNGELSLVEFVDWLEESMPDRKRGHVAVG